MRKIWVITLFPEIITSYFSHGVISKSLIENGGFIDLKVINPISFSGKGHKGVDSRPYGGGPGMVLRADVIGSALDNGVFSHYEGCKPKVIFTSPVGRTWNNSESKKLSEVILEEDVVFICGRYEGIDQRIIDLYVDLEISTGDFVLSGGELAVLTILDSSLRFCPGVLGNNRSIAEDSFENGGFDGPKYTRPRVFKELSVPDVLLSGNHKEIKHFNEPRSKKE